MLKNTALYAESWSVAYRKKSCGTILYDKGTPFNIINNSFRYWAADPFVFEYFGEKYIFAELYDYIHCKGGIGYCKLTEKGNTKWKMVLTEDFHMSYPFIAQIKDEIFLMPESSGSKTLFYYRAVDFPEKWEKCEVLRENVEYADTTPFLCEDQCFALTYDVKSPDNYKLCLLDLNNKNNDTVLVLPDIECRRPAGKMFSHKSMMIRPAQNCLDGYGKGLIFYEYSLKENSVSYNEKLIQNIYPQELKFNKKIFLDGMHTYNSDLNCEVIDIKTRRFNLLNLLFRIIKKIVR